MNIIETLGTYLERKRKSKHGYSLRILAKAVGKSPSYLSRVLRGQKPLTLDLFEGLAAALDVELETLTLLRDSLKPRVSSENPAGKLAEKPVSSEMLTWQMTDKKQFDVLREWYYLPILEFVTTHLYDGSTSSIAERLGLGRVTVEMAIHEMVQCQLLTVNGARLCKTDEKTRWSSPNSAASIRKFHASMMGRAQLQLQQETSPEAFANRLITGITLTAKQEKIDAARAKLANCLHEIANELIGESGDVVYHLSAQLFPLSR